MLKVHEKIEKLSAVCDKPLYIVGGYIRNYLTGGYVSNDVDLCSSLSVSVMEANLKKCNVSVERVNEKTGNIFFTIDNLNCEYTSFKQEIYGKGGKHVPEKTVFNCDLPGDAKRRDFKCNAIYYDIKNKKIIDPFNGRGDIANKILDTPLPPEKVFCNDGIRLLRLCRFCAELNFIPTIEVIKSAQKYRTNILDISYESIFAELRKIMESDCRYPFSMPEGPLFAFTLLNRIRVLPLIFEELIQGNAKALSRAVETLKYSQKDFRWHAFITVLISGLQDEKKGYNNSAEEFYGKILLKYGFNKRFVKKINALINVFQTSTDSLISDEDAMLFIAENFKLIDDLKALKQIEYSIDFNGNETCPFNKRIDCIIKKTSDCNIPLTVKQLKITAKDLLEAGYKKNVSKTLFDLLIRVIKNPELNRKETLLKTLNDNTDSII